MITENVTWENVYVKVFVSKIHCPLFVITRSWIILFFSVELSWKLSVCECCWSDLVLVNPWCLPAICKKIFVCVRVWMTPTPTPGNHPNMITRQLVQLCLGKKELQISSSPSKFFSPPQTFFRHQKNIVFADHPGPNAWTMCSRSLCSFLYYLVGNSTSKLPALQITLLFCFVVTAFSENFSNKRFTASIMCLWGKTWL